MPAYRHDLTDTRTLKIRLRGLNEHSHLLTAEEAREAESIADELEKRLMPANPSGRRRHGDAREPNGTLSPRSQVRAVKQAFAPAEPAADILARHARLKLRGR